MKEEHLYAVALTRLGGFNLPALMELYQRAGSATAIYEHRNNIHDILPDATQRLVETLETGIMFYLLQNVNYNYR